MVSGAAWFIVDMKRFQLVRSSFARALYLLEMDRLNPEGSKTLEDLSEGGFRCDGVVFIFSLS